VKKKNQTVKAAKAFTVSGAKGAVTYKKVSGNKKITVAANGKITVKKKLKKGIYKVKVLITAAGDVNYESGSKEVTLTIKIAYKQDRLACRSVPAGFLFERHGRAITSERYEYVHTTVKNMASLDKQNANHFATVSREKTASP
jgi:thioredoxin-related protein